MKKLVLLNQLLTFIKSSEIQLFSHRDIGQSIVFKIPINIHFTAKITFQCFFIYKGNHFKKKYDIDSISSFNALKVLCAFIPLQHALIF